MTGKSPQKGGRKAAAAAASEQQYMLHRSLPSLDLFTSSAVLEPADLAELEQHVKDTDVIALAPTSTSNAPAVADPSVPTPTLSDIVGQPATVAPAKPFVEPAGSQVSMLYYSPFSSFAPSYDSSASTQSYSRTTASLRSERRLKEWEDQLAAEPARKKLKVSSEGDAASTGAALNSEFWVSLGLDPTALPVPSAAEIEAAASGLTEELEELQDDTSDSAAAQLLERNAVHLRTLILAQWARLRATAPPSSRTKADPLAAAPALLASVTNKGVGESELVAANALRHSLTLLLASIKPDTDNADTPSILPPPEIWPSLTPYILASTALNRAQAAGKSEASVGFYGALADGNVKGLREAQMVRNSFPVAPMHS